MKLALAPMATLSHEALRILINRFGDPDEYFTEMIHAPSYITGGKFERWYVRQAPSPEKIVWQLTGPDSVSVAKAAALIAPLGGIGLDLNMGCSAPDIARFGSGIAWMLKERSLTAELVSSVRREIDQAAGKVSPDSLKSSTKSAPLRLGVKLRLGAEENFEDLLSFCRMLVEEGAEQITLHPRIKSDKYGRPARRHYVAELASALTVPVYGNGDIDSPEDALAFMRDFPCAGLMIGRSAVQKPWIFSDIRRLEHPTVGEIAQLSVAEPAPVVEPAIVDHLEVSTFFLETLKTSQPPEFHLSRAHRFFFYYCDNFRFAHHIKMRIQNAKTPDVIGGLLEEYFAQVPEDRYLSR
jgi:tRNA-dihydrouridine synthase B